jgi:hypothetical protein
MREDAPHSAAVTAVLSWQSSGSASSRCSRWYGGTSNASGAAALYTCTQQQTVQTCGALDAAGRNIDSINCVMSRQQHSYGTECVD